MRTIARGFAARTTRNTEPCSAGGRNRASRYEEASARDRLGPMKTTLSLVIGSVMLRRSKRRRNHPDHVYARRVVAEKRYDDGRLSARNGQRLENARHR